MDTYFVEADGCGGYQVRMAERRADMDPVVTGFPSAAKAQEWIDNRIQIAMKMATSSDIT